MKKQKKPSKQEIDDWRKKCGVGEYRKWTFSADRIKELSLQVTSESMERRLGKTYTGRKPAGSGLGTGKKQQAAEFERLKQELENG